MNKAWIAIAMTPAILLVGCKSKPEAAAPVPPPNYSTAEPEALPPLSISQGPVAGPGATPPASYEPAPIPVEPTGSRSYTIRKGDTLWSIATREYGNGQKWKDIAQANPSIDPKKLLIGTEITLP